MTDSEGQTPSADEPVNDAVDEAESTDQQPAPAATGLDTSPRERSDEAKATRTSIVVAIIALVSALIGGGIAATMSYVTTNMTVSAQAKQATEQYRRDQRKDIYANLLKEVTNLENELDSAKIKFFLIGVTTGMASIMPPLPPSEENPKINAIGQVQQEWHSAYAALDAAISNAELFSSERVIHIAMALRDNISDQYYHVLQETLSAGKPSIPGKFGDAYASIGRNPVDEANPQYDQSLRSLPTQKLRDMYLEAARQDLAIND